MTVDTTPNALAPSPDMPVAVAPVPNPSQALSASTTMADIHGADNIEPAADQAASGADGDDIERLLKDLAAEAHPAQHGRAMSIMTKHSTGKKLGLHHRTTSQQPNQKPGYAASTNDDDDDAITPGAGAIAGSAAAAVKVPEEMLQTDPARGLTSQEAEKRKRRFGPNQLAEHKENMLLKFIGFFNGPIQYVMLAAAALSAGLQEWVDLGVILGLLLLNAVVGFLQEFQAGNIVAQLRSQLALKANVMREGAVREIDGADVVPGDIVKLEEGIVVPADGRILGKDTFLQVDQSALTGESLAVEKRFNDTVYSSSAVKRGECFMVVTSTGDNTFVGRTASLTQSTQTRGKFTEVLTSIGTTLLVLVVFWILAIWISGFFRSLSIVTLLRYALIITVIGVPVGLPAVVTTTLAVGAAYLAKREAIVQRLSAIESLAGCEILCSDKTGTLTKNKLVLNEPFLMPGYTRDNLILACALASSRKKKGLDAIDKTVMLGLLTHEGARQAIKQYKTEEFRPFDPVTKRVSATVRDAQGTRIICVKGAPAAVLKLVEQDHPIDRKTAQMYNDKVDEFASRGFRSLGAAWKRGDQPWEIIGILCLFDPPRNDTARTIEEAKALGLKVKMLTGDAVGIAKETARQLHLGTNVYNTKLLVDGSMPGSELYDFVVAADGFAEVFPEHKYMVVDILQKRGYLVAMTGDGVNDAPSLKKADAGIAVEGASDAARSAADIVFLAPGLGTIIDAIKTSRQIFHRMYSYVVYRIALSLHLEIFLTTSLVILNQTISVQLVVFLAIFADIATLAIAYDHAPYALSPVKWDLPKIWGLAIVMGIFLAIGTWVMYGTLLMPGHPGIIAHHGNFQEILFLQSTLTENWLIFITRSTTSLWDTRPSWQLVGAVFAVDILASLFALFGWFSGQRTDIVTVVRVWIYCFGVFAIMAIVYFTLSNSRLFSKLVRGGERREKSLEDFMYNLERVSVLHEQMSAKRKIEKDKQRHRHRHHRSQDAIEDGAGGAPAVKTEEKVKTDTVGTGGGSTAALPAATPAPALLRTDTSSSQSSSSSSSSASSPPRSRGSGGRRREGEGSARSQPTSTTAYSAMPLGGGQHQFLRARQPSWRSGGSGYAAAGYPSSQDDYMAGDRRSNADLAAQVATSFGHPIGSSRTRTFSQHQQQFQQFVPLPEELDMDPRLMPMGPPSGPFRDDPEVYEPGPME
ncbi:plasma membrane H+-ATPase [Sorochytrium milnesiophthora]